MTRYTIGRNDAGQRADRFVARVEPQWGSHGLQKLFRRKDIKLDGRPCKADTRLPEGAVLTVYAPHAPAAGVPASRVPPLKQRHFPEPDIVYEDENLLLLWKPPGLLSQPDTDSDAEDTLLARARQYLLEKGDWRPERENAFAPALCHRLDRGTEGLLMAAKNAEALRMLTEKLRLGEIRKTYVCVVHGQPKPPQGEWVDYLFKDAQKRRVYTRSGPVPGAKRAALRYRTLKTRNGLSLMEIELLTGRTHQIRVQFASRGFPLLGDGKYGSQTLDKPFKPSEQALCAVRLAFEFTAPAGILEPLRGRMFRREKTFVEFC